MKASGRDQFMVLLRDAALGGTLEKLTLGKPSGRDATLVNLFVRPVSLQSGPHLAFVWRHATKDITKNHRAQEALGKPIALREGGPSRLFKVNPFRRGERSGGQMRSTDAA